MVSRFKNPQLGLCKGMHFSQLIKRYILDLCISSYADFPVKMKEPKPHMILVNNIHMVVGGGG